ncbi:flagellar hook-length control protein FliK [Pontibacillus salicampi]|uniref:Flagellar hook-length control protein FliK n=1 Tax=Pontibacillus salicampi TaxID=1449801 RepID=A0ABV6LP05_9BACI
MSSSIQALFQTISSSQMRSGVGSQPYQQGSNDKLSFGDVVASIRKGADTDKELSMKQTKQEVKQLLHSLSDEDLSIDEGMFEELKASPMWAKLTSHQQEAIEDLLSQSSTIVEIAAQLPLSEQGNAHLAILQQWTKEHKSPAQAKAAEALKPMLKTIAAHLLHQSLHNSTNTSTNITSRLQNLERSQLAVSLRNTQLHQDVKPLSVEKSEMSPKIEELAKNIAVKLQEMLHKNGTSPQTSKTAQQLMDLGRQWMQAQQTGDSTLGKQALENTHLSSKQIIAWDKAVSILHNRSSLNQGAPYSANAQVTPKDFSNWVRGAWQRLEVQNTSSNKDTSIENIIQRSVGGSDAMPMSRQEQLFIKLNSSQATPSNQQSLIEQFQKIISQSRFSISNAGSQLSIKLNPGNLGDMMVRMTQQNGEMMVKILVTSQAAKEMLESNMQQLRHMFSPSQVQIERQEQTATHQSSVPFSKEEKQQQEGQQSSRESYLDWLSEQEEEEDSVPFHELLQNEKA